MSSQDKVVAKPSDVFTRVRLNGNWACRVVKTQFEEYYDHVQCGRMVSTISMTKIRDLREKDVERLVEYYVVKYGKTPYSNTSVMGTWIDFYWEFFGAKGLKHVVLTVKKPREHTYGWSLYIEKQYL